MEGGLPMLNCLLQHTLRSLCSSPSTTSYSSNPSPKWVYAVFWRILPRIYPPPRWDYGGGVLDRSKGNKRNWILVWEDGYCDFYECERAGSGYVKGRFGADIFFKLSHEVYNYGEGLVGKVAADNSHKWIFREMPSENDPNFFSSWTGQLDSQPKAWEFQFNSGIQTIAIIAVREGIIQLGSLYKDNEIGDSILDASELTSMVTEDLNLVINIQRKFNYLQSIPGVFAIQRPYSIQSQQQANALRLHSQESEISHEDYLDDKRHVLTGGKGLYSERQEESSPRKSINLGWNSPQNRGALFAMPPLLPSMSCSLGALLSKLPCVVPPNQEPIQTLISTGNNVDSGSKIANRFDQGIALTSGISTPEPCSTAVNNASAVASLDVPESKPKTQESNPSQS